MRARRPLVTAALAVLLFVAAFLGVFIGTVRVDAGQALLALVQSLPGLAGVGGEVPASVRTIVVDLRLPRVTLAIFVGGALGIGGATMQGLLRNPLADPYLFGVSSGAAVGSAAVAVTGFAVLGAFTNPTFAFVGAMLATLLVYQVAQVGGRLPVEGVLLAGIAIGSLLAALASLIIFLDPVRRVHAIFWLLGGFQGAGWTEVAVVAPIAVAAGGATLLFARPLNAMAFGDETAEHLGVDTERTKGLLLFIVALLTAAAVSFAGIIGFVGVIVPHTMRLLVGPDHRFLLPASGLFGGSLLVVCDLVARASAPPLEVPVGILTAFLGAPFFVYLLRRNRRLQTWG
jgi:iron complex transport system permease protein